jgi:hypothetical protein
MFLSCLFFAQDVAATRTYLSDSVPRFTMVCHMLSHFSHSVTLSLFMFDTIWPDDTALQVGCLVCVTTHAGAVEHEELGEVTSIERPSMEDATRTRCLHDNWPLLIFLMYEGYEGITISLLAMICHDIHVATRMGLPTVASATLPGSSLDHSLSVDRSARFVQCQ